MMSYLAFIGSLAALMFGVGFVFNTVVCLVPKLGDYLLLLYFGKED